MTAPVESALEHWHKLLSIAHERKHHLDEGLVAIEARDAAVRADAFTEVSDRLAAMEKVVEAAQWPFRDYDIHKLASATDEELEILNIHPHDGPLIKALAALPPPPEEDTR